MPGGGRPILVVDDDSATLRLAEVALSQRGYRALGAPGAAAGLRAVQTAAPAAVILDLVMPEMDGFEFLDRFRGSSDARARTPVIV